MITRLHEVESLIWLGEHNLQTRKSHALLDRLGMLQSRHPELRNWFHCISLRLQREGYLSGPDRRDNSRHARALLKDRGRRQFSRC